MPIVKIEMWNGRTSDQKAQLAKEITDSFERLGTARDATIVAVSYTHLTLPTTPYV